MSKENYFNKIGRETSRGVGLRFELDKLKKKLNDPTLSPMQKADIQEQIDSTQSRYNNILGSEKRAGTIDRLSRPVERSLGIGKAGNITRANPAESFQEGGGPAIEPTRKPQKAAGNIPEETPEAGGETAEAPKEPKKNATGALVDKARDAAKKFAVQTAKKLATSLVANPYVWIIGGGILVALLIIVLLYAYFGGMAGRSPNPTGASMTQAANPVKDKDLINKILLLSGAKDIKNELTDNFFNDLIPRLNDLNSGTSDQKIKDKVQEILKNIETYKSNNSDSSAKVLVASLNELVDLITQIPVFSGATKPIMSSIAGYNNSLHGGTVLRPEHVDFHGVYTSGQYDKGTCDAVDLKQDAKTEINAVFGGTAKTVSDDHGHWMVIVTNNSYAARYAHMSNPIASGQIVAGQKIGEISSIGHVHFELNYKGKCVVTTPNDKQKWKQNGGDIGKYLWERMKLALKQ